MPTLSPSQGGSPASAGDALAEPAAGGALLSVFAGSGIGVLIGVLMGLAVSPTVGIIIGALASSLALILGLNDQHFSRSKALRIGCFGFACVLAAPLGIYVRTHSLLVPSLEEQLSQYTSVGFSEEEARAFVQHTRFGIVSPDWKMAQGGAVATPAGKAAPGPVAPLAQAAMAGVLFSADVDYSSCDDLANTTAELDVDDVVGNFRFTGGFWEDLADAVEGLPREARSPALLMVRDGLCTQGYEIEDDGCRRLAVGSASDEATVQSAFSELGGLWQSLAEAASASIEEGDRGRVLLTLKEVMCRDNS